MSGSMELSSCPQSTGAEVTQVPVRNERNAFLDLPSEIHRMIFSYIPRPSDLKSLCLTCKEIRILAVEPLYNTVELRPHRYTTSHLKDIFHSRNIGVVYIRGLFDRSSQFSDNTAKIDTFLSLLPHDGLKAICCDYQPGHGLEFLFTQQQKLVVELQTPVIVEAVYALDYFPWFKTLRKLSLKQSLCETRVPADAFIRALKSCSQLQELSRSDLRFLRNSKMLTTGDDMKDGLKGYPLCGITSLTLGPEDLSEAYMLPNILNLSRLTSLDIMDIDTLPATLKTFVSAFHQEPSALQNLHICKGAVEPDTMRDFLMSVHGLRTLCLDMVIDSEDELNALVDGVLLHVPSLRQLYLGVAKHNNQTHYEEPWPLPSAKLHQICAAASHLQQLALPMPDININVTDQENWGAYGEAIDEIATIPNLSLFHIITFPKLLSFELPSYKSALSDYCREVVPPLFDCFATRFMQRYQKSLTVERACPVIFFGTAFVCWEHGLLGFPEFMNHWPAAYIPRKREDAFGNTELYAAFIDARLLKYLGLDSDVVNYSTKDEKFE